MMIPGFVTIIVIEVSYVWQKKIHSAQNVTDVSFFVVLGVFMGDPAPGGEDEEPKEIRPEDYIIIDDTDSDPDDSDDDHVDEAGVDIMESSTDQNF